MKQIRCNSCRGWFPAEHYICPECEEPRPGYNKWLASAQFANALYQQAEDSRPENTYQREYARYKREIDTIARDL